MEMSSIFAGFYPLASLQTGMISYCPAVSINQEKYIFVS